MLVKSLRHIFCLGLYLGPGFSIPLYAADEWNTALPITTITSNILPEASGIAASAIDPDRIYLVNDGTRSSFVAIDLHHSEARTVALSGVRTVDSEEIAVGACPDHGSCIYVADIGDNPAQRSNIKIYIIRERSNFDAAVAPDYIMTLSYPDGRGHNAESFSIHPNGYGYLLTKETPAHLYRINLRNISIQSRVELEYLGYFDLTSLFGVSNMSREMSPQYARKSKLIPTSFAIHPNGKEFVIMTKKRAHAITFDLSDLSSDQNISIDQILQQESAKIVELPLEPLPQMEAITYSDNGDSLLYTSEITPTSPESMPVNRLTRK